MRRCGSPVSPTSPSPSLTRRGPSISPRKRAERAVCHRDRAAEIVNTSCGGSGDWKLVQSVFAAKRCAWLASLNKVNVEKPMIRIGFASWGVRLNSERIEGGPALAGQARSIGRRSGAVAALLATIAGCAIAFWAWLDGSSLRAPLSDPASVGARTPSAASTIAERPAQTPLTRQTPQVTATTEATDTQAPPAHRSPPGGNAADQVIQMPSVAQAAPASSLATDKGGYPPIRTTVREISPAVVRGTQSSPVPEVASDSNTAVFRGKQAAETVQSAPNSGPSVVRGTQAPVGPSTP